MVVVAETERLELREFSVDDAEGFYRLNADPEVLRYTGDEPFEDVEAARAFIEAYDSYACSGFGRWSVYIKEAGEYIGFCGLNRRAETDEVDVGFRIRRESWGRGYATEAAGAALDLGFRRYGLTRIVGRAMRDNAASHRVLVKLGMTFSHEFEQDGQVWVVYESVMRSAKRGVGSRTSTW